jgi:hypothetical protein
MSLIQQSTLHFFTGWRSLLAPSGGAVLSPTAIALLGVTGLYGGQKPKDDSAASDADILNSALGGEFGAVSAYQLAADSGASAEAGARSRDAVPGSAQSAC